MCGGQAAWQKSAWQLLDSQTLTLCVVKLLCPSCDAALCHSTPALVIDYRSEALKLQNNCKTLLNFISQCLQISSLSLHFLQIP